MTAPRGPALQELVERLERYNVAGDPKDIATVFLEIIREKTGQRLSDWVGQLAVDLLHHRAK